MSEAKMQDLDTLRLELEQAIDGAADALGGAGAPGARAATTLVMAMRAAAPMSHRARGRWFKTRRILRFPFRLPAPR